MNKKISEQSDEELLALNNRLKVVVSVLAGVLLVLIVSIIILMMQKGFNVLSVVPIALLPILVVNVKSLKEIRAELKKRKLIE